MKTMRGQNGFDFGINTNDRDVWLLTFQAGFISKFRAMKFGVHCNFCLSHDCKKHQQIKGEEKCIVQSDCKFYPKLGACCCRRRYSAIVEENIALIISL